MILLLKYARCSFHPQNSISHQNIWIFSVTLLISNTFMNFVTLEMVFDRWCGSWRHAGFFSKPTCGCPLLPLPNILSLCVYNDLYGSSSIFGKNWAFFYSNFWSHCSMVFGLGSRPVQLVNFDLGRNQISPFRYRSRSFWNNYSTTKWKIRKGQKCHGQASNPTWAGLVSSETPRTWTASTQKMSRSLSTRPGNYYLD